MNSCSLIQKAVSDSRDKLFSSSQGEIIPFTFAMDLIIITNKTEAEIDYLTRNYLTAIVYLIRNQGFPISMSKLSHSDSKISCFFPMNI